MPVVAGPALAGGRIGPADYRGKVVVVNFWNPFCPPCRREQPVLERAWRRLRGHGVFVVGVHYVGQTWPDDEQAALAHLRRFRVTYPSLRRDAGELARSFGIPGIPATVLIDRRGEMRYRVLGALQAGQLEELLADVARHPAA